MQTSPSISLISFEVRPQSKAHSWHSNSSLTWLNFQSKESLLRFIFAFHTWWLFTHKSIILIEYFPIIKYTFLYIYECMFTMQFLKKERNIFITMIPTYIYNFFFTLIEPVTVGNNVLWILGWILRRNCADFLELLHKHS